MSEQMPKTVLEQTESSEGVSKTLEVELGPSPEGLEKSLAWTDREQIELTEAVAAKAGEDASLWEKAARRVSSRIVMTGLAIATLTPMMTSEAQAGERGRNWGRRAGTIVSVVGGIGERVLMHKEREHIRNARDTGFKLRMLEREGGSILRRMDRIVERSYRLKERLDAETDKRHKEYLEDKIRQLEVEMDELRGRAEEIDALVVELGEDFQKEASAANKAGIFRDIADLVAREGRWAGRGW